MVESNTVTVTYSEEVPPTGKIKCWFCEETFDTEELMFKHLWDAHKDMIAVLGIAIVIVIALLFYWLRE